MSPVHNALSGSSVAEQPVAKANDLLVYDFGETTDILPKGLTLRAHRLSDYQLATDLLDGLAVLVLL